MLQEESDAFAKESEALAQLIDPLQEKDWSRPTQFKGWTINDVITHLHSGNLTAITSLTDPEAYLKMRTARAAAAAAAASDLGNLPFQRAFVGNITYRTLFDAWRRTCDDMAKAFASADPRKRVPWGGREMSARSSVSARLMETWAHGQEVYDLLGVERRHTDRLFHVATLAVNTFGWSFANRKLPVPLHRPLVKLLSPSGTDWEWPATGKPDSNDRIEGQAFEFCQVAAQTRNIADTRLRVTGEVATRWMCIAQCFAGPPRVPPAPGTRSRQV